MSSNRDRWLVERAAHEASRAGWLLTAPNPRVGALAFRDGHWIGTGRHSGYGGPHAEEDALRDAGAWDEEAARPLPGVVDEMVVSLEPCSAEGGGKKRPPCARLLREAGVRRVVVGAMDPDPRHRGRGLEQLRADGVAVHLVPAGEAAFAARNAAFLSALRHPRRPWILLKWAASLDGKTAATGGESQWITGPEARAEAHRLRAHSDAVLVGPRTLAQDDPELTARSGDGAPLPQPLRVLLATHGPPPPQARVRRTPGRRLWLIAEGARQGLDLVDGPEDVVLALPRLASGHLDLAEGLVRLRRDHGVRRLLVEGGAHLHGHLLLQGLVDAVVRYEAPILMGGEHGALLGAGFSSPAAATRLQDEERAELGGDLRRAFLVTAEAGHGG